MNERLAGDPDYKRAIHATTLQIADPEHSEHVTWLSLRLFDQLAPHFELAPEERALLATAAYWHDVGHQRSSEHHHRYGYDLIAAQPLEEFNSDERVEIANIARYHRQSDPSVEHTGFRNLPRGRRAAVVRLASLLRLAEALDAGHSQLVRDVSCTVSTDSVVISVISNEFPMLEIELAQARSGLFRESFGRRIVLRRSAEAPGQPNTTNSDSDSEQ